MFLVRHENNIHMKFLSVFSGFQEESLLTAFLKILGVKHNKDFTDNYYNEHPYNYCLFGLYSSLQDYGVESVALKIDDKKEIVSLEAPFIAQIADDFVIVSDIDADSIDYNWRGKRITSSLASFLETWTGIVLMARPRAESGEPEFTKHHKEETFKQTLKFSLVGILFIWGVLHLFLTQDVNILSGGLLLINLSGIYITSLLVLKQIHIHNGYADKLCSLFYQNGCNNILETSAAKLGGLISWSELGLSYFIGNLIIILLAPGFMSYLILLNLLTLPYSFWSIWYQKFRAKQWCTLCLIVQGILWLMAITNLVFGSITLPQFRTIEVLYVGFIYLLPYLSIALLLPVIGNAARRVQGIQQTNSIKMREEIFTALLKKQPYYEVEDQTTQIKFGNPAAGLQITILSNPHCNPCAKMHKRVEKLLKVHADKLGVRYIFSSFGEKFYDSNFFLTTAYLNHPIEYAQKIYTEWFEQGVTQKEKFFGRFPQDIENNKVQEEFKNHQDWIAKTKLRATPTILINGYLLPKEYQIEDMKYFTDVYFAEKE